MTARLVSPHARVTAVVLGLLLTTLGAISTASAADPITIEVVVSPNVLNLRGAGVLLTVHADIPYNAVDPTTVELRDDHGNFVVMDWCKADDRGDFVAKFVMAEVVHQLELAPDGINNLTLAGMTTDQVAFAGTDGVKVIERSGR